MTLVYVGDRGLTIPRAGELTSEELERIVTIIQNPTQYKIPSWFLNRQRDIVDGKDSQILANGVDSKLRDDLERLKKIRAHRGLRWCFQEEGWLSVCGNGDTLAGWSAAFQLVHALHLALLLFSMKQ
jgi:hypothetical protein